MQPTPGVSSRAGAWLEAWSIDLVGGLPRMSGFTRQRLAAVLGIRIAVFTDAFACMPIHWMKTGVQHAGDGALPRAPSWRFLYERCGFGPDSARL